MLHWWIERELKKSEAKLGASADYLRHILKSSTTAFLKFTKILPLANYRKACPADAWHVARLVATLHEDCGSCVQIEVNLAKQDGVPTALLQSVLARKPDELPAPLPDVYRFAEAVVRNSSELDGSREKIRSQLGEPALVELSMAIAACRVFPVTKRSLGYAKSCSLVRVEV